MKGWLDPTDKMNHVNRLDLHQYSDCIDKDVIQNTIMPCYCSNCFPSRNLRRNRTIREHLREDEAALDACGRHDLKRSAHLQGCIQRNVQFLATNTEQVVEIG
jgi:hypothetical protein